MPSRTHPAVFESVLRALWHVVEVYVFVVLIVKDRKVPDWNASRRVTAVPPETVPPARAADSLARAAGSPSRAADSPSRRLTRV